MPELHTQAMMHIAQADKWFVPSDECVILPNAAHQ
jgi:hypothetical protein